MRLQVLKRSMEMVESNVDHESRGRLSHGRERGADMTFKAWLMQQMKRDDRVGKLARNVQKDRTWPPTQDMVKLRQYLLKSGSVENASSALDQAYAEYQKQGDRLRPSGVG